MGGTKDRTDSSKDAVGGSAPASVGMSPRPAGHRRVTYAKCAGDDPTMHPCRPARRPVNVAAASIASSRGAIERAALAAPAPHPPQGDGVAAERVSSPLSSERVTQAPRPSTAIGPETSAVALSVADILDRADGQLSEDDVMVVGDADDLEFIPVGAERTTMPAVDVQPKTATPTPAPTTTTKPVEAVTTVATVTTPPKSRAKLYMVAAGGAVAALFALSQREAISAGLREAVQTAEPSARATRSARLMRFDVPDLVVSIPMESEPEAKTLPVTKPGRVAGPMARDAASLAELERLASQLPPSKAK